jgi:5-methylcytosine-specific restriction endonuclease McrA
MEAAESTGVGSEEWALAHEALSKLRLRRATLDAEEGTWLLRAFRAATHVYFGYACFGEYIERLFGLSRRATEEKLRVAGALEALPELAQALRSAKLNWSVVRELSRVAVAETEHEWILAACGKTARQVERMVSGLAPGARPADRRRPELIRHILRFEVGAETLASFREAMKELQKRSDHRLDDDAALLLMAREVLRGPGDAGRASYQLVVTQCEDCGRGFQHANGDLVQLDPAIVEMCHCDAQNVPAAHVHGATADAPDCPTAKAGKRAEARAAPAHAGVSAELAHAHTDAGVTAELAGAHYAGIHTGNADELALAARAVCGTGEVAHAHTSLGRGAGEVTHAHSSLGGGAGEVAHVDAAVGNAGELARAHARVRREAGVTRAGLKRRRATQGTPPAIRREVFWRDRGRCVVPGCRNATFVDLHHLDLRSEGGENDPDNLVVLCGAHHGALHRGRLRIDGRVSTGLRVSHADGTVYGFIPTPALADASARVFAGLRRLGFSEKTARASLEQALASAAANATAETLLRSAVARANCR